MNSGYDDTLSFEKSPSVIIDLGLKLTKIGIGGESDPRKILPSPGFFAYDKFMEMGYGNDLTYNPMETILSFRRSITDVKFEIDEFIHKIFVIALQLKKLPREKNYVCILCLDFSLSNFSEIYEYFINSILSYPVITSVRVVPKNLFPIFSTGFSSGIVIDAGYAATTITPINNGVPFFHIAETIPIGASELERCLKKFIIEDSILNPNYKKKIISPDLFVNGINKYLDDLLVRCAICVNKKISNTLQDDESKLKADTDYSKVDYCTDVQEFQISFLNRIKLGEKLFGNPLNDEINIAYSLLNVLMKIPCEDRKKLSQNIVLSGGMCMLLGFYKRFNEEITELIELPQFKKLKGIQSAIKVHKIIFPRNCLTWIGASILSNFERLNFKSVSFTKEENDMTEGTEKTNKTTNSLKKIFEIAF